MRLIRADVRNAQDDFSASPTLNEAPQELTLIETMSVEALR